MDKRFWAIIGVIAIVFVGFMWFGGNKDKNTTGSDSGDSNATTNHIKGNPDAKVTLLEYGDFQCPVCALYYPVVEQVVAKYKDEVKFQFRHLPLTRIHQHAFAAARAAEAADQQGKFWEMYDLLYQNQQSWASNTNNMDVFKQYATQLSLDVAKFEADFASANVNKLINNDIAAFNKTGIDQATPSFFLNGTRIQNSQLANEQNQPQLEKFSKFIDEELKKQQPAQ